MKRLTQSDAQFFLYSWVFHWNALSSPSMFVFAVTFCPTDPHPHSFPADFLRGWHWSLKYPKKAEIHWILTHWGSSWIISSFYFTAPFNHTHTKGWIPKRSSSVFPSAQAVKLQNSNRSNRSLFCLFMEAEVKYKDSNTLQKSDALDAHLHTGFAFSRVYFVVTKFLRYNLWRKYNQLNLILRFLY